jgi:hypothetical protein
VLFHLTARLTARVTLRFGTFLSSKERQTPAMDETRENPLLRKNIYPPISSTFFNIYLTVRLPLTMTRCRQPAWCLSSFFFFLCPSRTTTTQQHFLGIFFSFPCVK